MTQPFDQDARDGVSAQQMAGTPSPLPPGQSDDALATVELGPVLAHVAGFAAGPLGAARVRARRPTTDVEWIREELARVGETALLFRRGEGLLAEAVPDVQRPLARLRVEGSVLEAHEAAALRRMLAAARLVAQDLRRVADAAPRAAALLAPLPDKTIERRLELAVDDDGQVLDTASPALAAARRDVQTARARLIRRLEELLRRIERDGASGGSVTMRGGRYVIPVRRELRQRPSGIIHDESASAGTLFIEPAEAVELGNALREAEVAEERETLRVLRELTALLRPALDELRGAFEMCIAVDDLVARARYMAAHDAEVPAVELAPAPLVVVNGRHPLLLAQAAGVVPFDLAMSRAERTLLVSGPNTGGKTVLLKATALLSALAQSGIVPPAGAGTLLPAYDAFFADIGDRQSISASLSTFSAHVAMLRRILEEAGDGSLVLLDEVGSGTDPAEGAALAAAVLVALTRRGTLTLATTHLGALKSLAAAEPGVVNASLEFDSATLTPTYRFTKGVPGRSYGLAIARRLGVSPAVLTDAEARVPTAERELDTLLAEVEARRQALDAAEIALSERLVDADALAARLRVQEESQTARDSELRRREKEADRQGREQARRYLLEARERVEEALGVARRAADQAEAREARRIVEAGIQGAGETVENGTAGGRTAGTATPGTATAGAGTAGAGTAATAGAGQVTVGRRVRVRGMTGEVLDVRSDGKLSVGVGAMRMVVDASEATLVAGAPPSRPQPSAAAPAGESHDAAFEIDLRGMTGDEAEAVTLAAIDAAVLAEHPYLRVIHGKGTGVVRERVRRLASSDRRVARFEFAPAPQGGTGVTILEFGA
jgi:DNA mismatch repair protein MutS2